MPARRLVLDRGEVFTRHQARVRKVAVQDIEATGVRADVRAGDRDGDAIGLVDGPGERDAIPLGVITGVSAKPKTTKRLLFLLNLNYDRVEHACIELRDATTAQEATRDRRDSRITVQNGGDV
jgi:hypothetical protein